LKKKTRLRGLLLMVIARRALSLQSLNVEALRHLGAALRKPSLLVPHVALNSVADLDCAALYAAGLRAVVFDKDNTLTPPYADEPSSEAAAAIADAVAVFGRENCVVLSNSVGAADDFQCRGAERAEKALGLRVVRHARKKPDCLPDLRAALPHDLADVAVVGDRLLTDVLFANRFGMFAVHLATPITLRGDNPPALVLRFLENSLFLPLFCRRGRVLLEPPPHPAAARYSSSSSLLPRSSSRRR